MSQTLDIINNKMNLVHTYADIFKNGGFFLRFGVASCENGGFRKRSPEWRFSKTSFSCLRVGGYKRRFSIRPKKKYVCFLFHPVKSLGRVGRLSFFFFNFFYNLILTTNIQHIKVAHNLEHRSGISRHVV